MEKFVREIVFDPIWQDLDSKETSEDYFMAVDSADTATPAAHPYTI